MTTFLQKEKFDPYFSPLKVQVTRSIGLKVETPGKPIFHNKSTT